MLAPAEQRVTWWQTGESFPIVRRGYDPEQVEAFATAASDELKRLIEENRQLKVRIEQRPTPAEPAALAARQEPSETSVIDHWGEETTKLLNAAKENVQNVVAQAEERAARIVVDANEKAARIVAEATARAENHERQAKARADELTADAHAIRSRMVTAAEERQRTVRDQLDKLLGGWGNVHQMLTEAQSSVGSLKELLETASTSPGFTQATADPTTATRGR